MLIAATYSFVNLSYRALVAYSVYCTVKWARTDSQVHP